MRCRRKKKMNVEEQIQNPAVRTLMTRSDNFNHGASRRWFCTFQGTKEEIEPMIDAYMEKLEFRYACIGYEKVPSAGKPHAHLYIALRKLWRARSLRTYFENFRPDMEPAKGSLRTEQQCIDYCRKDGDWAQYGETFAKVKERLDREQKCRAIMNDWICLSKEEFDAKHPYEAIHWRTKLTLWESQKMENTIHNL